MPVSPLIQLVSIGQVDQYLSLTPQLSYFKYVYKRHTRFALDNLKLNFDSTTVPRLGNSENICIKKIERHGDLLSNLTSQDEDPKAIQLKKGLFKTSPDFNIPAFTVCIITAFLYAFFW